MSKKLIADLAQAQRIAEEISRLESQLEAKNRELSTIARSLTGGDLTLHSPPERIKGPPDAPQATPRGARARGHQADVEDEVGDDTPPYMRKFKVIDDTLMHAPLQTRIKEALRINGGNALSAKEVLGLIFDKRLDTVRQLLVRMAKQDDQVKRVDTGRYVYVGNKQANAR